MTTKIALILAVVMGVVAAVAVRSYIVNMELKARAEMETIDVVFVRRNLKKGEVATWKSLSRQPVPKKFFVRGMITRADGELYANKVVKADVEAGYPLFKQFLQSRDTDPLGVNQNVIPQGMTTVRLRVGATESDGFMIKPGDYVDVIGTFDQRSLGATAHSASGSAVSRSGRETMTLPLMEAVKVFAVDKRTMDVRATDRRSRDEYRTVSLLVKSPDALRLVDAESKGTLRLLRRAPSDVEKRLTINKPYSFKELGK